MNKFVLVNGFLLSLCMAFLFVDIVIDIIDGAVGKAANKVNAGILDCVEQQIITPEQAHKIFEYINKTKP